MPGKNTQLEGLIEDISNRTVEALKYGAIINHISRQVEIEPVDGMNLEVGQGIYIANEIGEILANPDTPNTMGSHLFPEPSAEDEKQSLWLHTGEDKLWLPDGTQGSASWHIPNGTGVGFFDPRSLEYTKKDEEEFDEKLADTAAWIGERLLESPTFTLLRGRSPYADRGGEAPLSQQDTMQEFSNVLTYNSDGELTETKVQILLRKLVRGKAKYEHVYLYPNQDPTKSTSRVVSLDGDSEPVTIGGLKRVRAALGRFEEEFATSATATPATTFKF